MSYELRSGQAIGKDLRRIFRQQIKGALVLARGEKEPEDTLVHEMRKHLKKARAVLQLMRRKLDRATFRRENRRLRNVGRLMTEIRDAEVRLQTMRQLEDITHHHYRSYQKIERLLAAELESFLAAFGGWEKKALPLLQRARKQGKKWPTSRYREQQLRRAKELGHLLGRVHDLTFLANRLRLERREKHWGKQDDGLLAAIENSAAELQRDGIELAERFFAESRSEFGAHVDEWFANRTHHQQIAEPLLSA